MHINRHDDSPWLSWREGVTSRVWSSALSGANNMHMGEQFFEPGAGVPRHWHYYEEHLTIYSGRAEVTVDDETEIIDGPATVLFPARSVHQFTSVGDTPLHIIGAASWPIHETLYADDKDGVVTRGWEPGYGYERRRMVTDDRPAD